MTDFIDLEREIAPGEDRRSTDPRDARATAVVVAGMHRSGTSALVRVLALLGLDLPQTPYPTRPDNPLGYWESLPVVEAHEEFLAAVGSSFDDFSAFGDGALRGPAARALEDRLVEVLGHEYGTSPQFVVKDPRICRLIPVWIAALERFGAVPRFVLPVRNPLEVAASLKLRNEYGTTKSLLLWLRHVLEAEQHTRGCRRSVVSYEQLLRDWHGVAEKISHELGLVWPRTSHSSHAEIEQFLSPRRRHHAFAADELDARPDVVDWVKATYGVLTATAEGEQLEQDVLDEVRGELERADRAFGPLLAELSLSHRAQEAALTEQATKLDEARAAAESRARDLDDRTQSLREATAEMERLAAELAQQRDALAAATTEAAASREQVEQLQAGLAERERVVTEGQAEIPRLTAELAQRQEALEAATADAADSRRDVERLQAQLTDREGALEHARTELGRLTQELAQREQAIAEARTEIPRLTAELARRQEAHEAATADAAAAREQIERLQAELTDREHALAEARSELADLTAELGRREEALTAATAAAAITRDQIERLRADLTEHEAALAAARSEVAHLTENLARTAEQRAEAEETARELEHRVRALVDAAAEQEARARRARREVADLRAGLASRGERLAKLQASLTGAREQRAELLRELQSRADSLSTAQADNHRLELETEAARAEIAERDSQLSRLEEEKAELAATVTALQREAERTKIDLDQRRDEMSRNAALVESLREKIAARVQAEAKALNELEAANAALAAGRSDIDRLSRELAEREAQLAKLQARRFARPRTKRRAFSQFLSWLARPHRGGWHLVAEYRRLRRAGTFEADAYLAENPDVDASGLDPLMHYLEHGIREGRALAPTPAEAPTVSGATEAPVLPAPAVDPQVPAPAAEPAIVVAPRIVEARPPAKPLPPSDYGDFIVLLSRQRSGTNPLRSVLGTHPDVFCFNEVFNLADRDSPEPLLRESNFFTFVERYGRGDIRRTMPDNHERLFLDFLEYLRCLSDKRYALIDVKYSTTHFLTRPHQQPKSYFFELLMKHGLYVLNVTRRNYLRYVLSTEKAFYSRRYTVDQGDTTYADEEQKLSPKYVLSELARCREEDERIERELSAHDRVLRYDYAEIFPGNGIAIAPDFLERFSDWRGIPNEFVVDPEYRKQSTLPLHETLVNFDEVAAALSDGPFAYCLEDEPAYRGPRATVTSTVLREHVASAGEPETPGGDWQSVIGSDPESFVDDLCRTRPKWITGSLSGDDARFLFRQALETRVDEAVEIGTASGFSTAVLAHAFHFRATAGRAPKDWRVRSYDILERLYFDHDRRVGDAAREILPESVLDHVEFNAPATAVDVGERYAADSIGFLFVDANHKHPWPVLDLLAVLGALRPGATVLLHDINLPRIHAEFPVWGVNRVFEDLDVEKLVPDVEIPNIGAFLVPDDKGRLRDQLLAVIDRHPWEAEVADAHVQRVLGARSHAALP
jgi:hypothetical protein